MNDDKRALVIAASGLLALAVLVLDLMTPVGVEVWVLYLPVILAAAWINDPRGVVLSALVCAAFVIIGSFFAPPGEIPPPWWDALNRAMGLSAMGLAAWMGIIICHRATGLAEKAVQLQTEVTEHQRTEAELRASEERLQLAAQGSGMGTWDLDLRTGHLFWSEAQFRLLGYMPRPDGKATIDMWKACLQPDDLPRVLQAQDQARRDHSLYCPEYQVIRADNGETVWLAAFGRYRYDDAGLAIGFAGVCFDITNRKRLEHETVEIAAREQRRIGQELHDGLGQELTGLGLMASALTQQLPAGSSESRIAHRLIAGFDRVHQKARTLARGLIPVHVEAQGLSAALQDLATRLTEQSGTRVTFQSQEGVEALDHTAATQLFHIAQEAATNALRHAQPSSIKLKLTSNHRDVCLAILDDGIGINASATNGKGMGLNIMRYRADQIGGMLSVAPAEGGGTIVTCTVNKREANDAQR